MPQNIEYYQARPRLEIKDCVVVVRDLQHQFIASNLAFSHYSSRSPEQLVGLSDSHMPWKSAAHLFIANDLDTLCGEESIIIEHYPHLDNAMLITKKSVVYSDGLAAGVLSMGLPFNGQYVNSILQTIDSETQRTFRNKKLKKSEYLILYLLSQGHKHSKIITASKLTASNYDFYVSQLKIKLGVNTTNQLIVMAYKEGLNVALPDSYIKDTK